MSGTDQYEGPSQRSAPGRSNGLNHLPAFLRNRRADVHDTAPWSPFAYVTKQLASLVDELVDGAALEPGALVVDYGCATAPYRSVFSESSNYIGADLPGNPDATVALRPDGSVPLPDGSVDLVLSTQVLEHVADPEAYLTECARLLKTGGSLVLTTHGIMYLHRDPEDYWRWTCDGLERTLNLSGFSVDEERGLLGLVPTSLQLFQDGTLRRVPRFLRKSYVLLFQRLIAVSDGRSTEAGRRENGLVLGARATKSS
jgi:SAM-dependent methyltransferase